MAGLDGRRSASRRAGSACVGPFYCNVFFPPFPSFSLSSFPRFSSRRENELSLIRAKVLGARAGRAALALPRFQPIVDNKTKKKKSFHRFQLEEILIFNKELLKQALFIVETVSRELVLC